MKARIGWQWAAVLLSGGLAVGVMSAAPAQAQPGSERERQREIFREGWTAAGRGDQKAIVAAIDRLGDYPLVPYLEFELLRQRIDSRSVEFMSKYLARYRDWTFAGILEIAWLRSLGQRDEFDALLRYGRDAADIEVRCHVARAKIARGRVDGLEADIEPLWMAGQSRPSACDGAFSWWRRQGNPTAEAAWRRFLLAAGSGETALARYLRRYLPADERIWADRWLEMYARPHVVLRQARQWRDHDQSRALVRFGVKRVARSDWERAAQLWAQLEAHFAWPEEDRRSIERELALFRAVALDAGAVDAIDGLDASVRDDQMLAWRARVAMARDLWSQVLESIQAMSLREQARSRWRYWRARALAELQRPEAAVVFSSLSAEADYYGFLAAVRLGQSLSLCDEEIDPDAAVQRRLMRDSEFERALELFHVGLYWHARRTWSRVARRLVADQLDQAALLAAGQGWHDLAIRALNEAGRRQAYRWRFPMAEKGRVLTAARQYNVDPALVYGLMRAESAMQPDARSSAGALGLLQLMPDTAGEVARRRGLHFPGAHALTDPRVNVPLGIAHLAELEDRFDGNWLRIAAGYNAGVNAVERWLDERPDSEPDVWIETLPYHETRDYVPRVLAFATIYEWQLERDPAVLSVNLDLRPAGRPGFACPP